MDSSDRSSLTTVLHRSADRATRRTWRSMLVGKPLPTEDAPHQTIGKFVGLAVFASDALSSTAYASQEILHILAFAGAAALPCVFPISIAIIVLLAIVTLSYEQTIHAYPSGGGAYIVARDNLGEVPAQIAGAALLTDYILTVSVSISSGVAQITSAWPALYDYRVPISIALVMFITLINLRGVKESGSVFALPTYFFVVMMFITVIIGLCRHFAGTLGQVVSPPEMEHATHTVLPITAFLLLHAFSSGTAALTGVEAISNGIQAFNEPKSHNAGVTLMWMSGILGLLFLAISFLCSPIHAVPSEMETVISQLARTVFDGRGTAYLLTIGATTVILIMAANTSFADFPRLSALLAADGFLPRQLTYRGSRLVFSKGILALALLACILIAVFKASVNALIPLYAIGVFLSFTLSQGGMARRWFKCGRLRAGEEIRERGSVLHFERSWPIKMVINGAGAVLTFVVMIVFAITKFASGAWVVLLIIPLLVLMFSAIHAHYRHVAVQLTLDRFIAPPRIKRNRVLVPISGVHAGSLMALQFARSISDDVTAVHVSTDPEAAHRVREKWDRWGHGVRLVMLESPYRQLLDPLLRYINELLDCRQPNETLTIVVPQFVPAKMWQHLLHTQAAMFLRMALLFRRGVVVVDVPYQLDEQ